MACKLEMRVHPLVWGRKAREWNVLCKSWASLAKYFPVLPLEDSGLFGGSRITNRKLDPMPLPSAPLALREAVRAAPGLWKPVTPQGKPRFISDQLCDLSVPSSGK